MASSQSPIDLLLVGTGAVGSFFAGKLTTAGIPVSCVARSDFDIIKRQGVRIINQPNDFRFTPQKVYAATTEVETPPDFVLISLKALPDIDLATMLKPLLAPKTALVMIQNGIENEAQVAALFPENEIIGGIAYVGVARIEPGVVENLGTGSLTLGSHPNGLSTQTRQLAALFELAGVPVRLTEDIAKERWRKMLWNASFNPISVLGGKVDSLRMLADDESTALVRAVMVEVLLLADRLGHRFAADTIDKTIAGTRKLKAFKTSMLVDYEAGRSMETEAILGNAVRLARREGVSVPRLETLYALLKMQGSI